MTFQRALILAQLLLIGLGLPFSDANPESPTIPTPEPTTGAPPCPAGTKEGCTGSCFTHCDNLNGMTENCDKACRRNCECPKGLVFESADSMKCVDPCTCKVNCTENSYYHCRTWEMRRSCATLKSEPVTFNKCKPRCVCNPKYVLSNGEKPRCILKSECPRSP